MKNTMILIAGRTGAGKDTYARILKEKGLKEVLSYTTRPKRYEDENTHIFITEKEAEEITDKVATTVINGYQYFATQRQIDEADYYIIDPIGIKELTQNCPDTSFYIIYIAALRDTRLQRAALRGDDTLKEIEIFEKRDESEDAQFTAFEQLIGKYDNIIVHTNDQDSSYRKLKKEAEEDLKYIGY